MACPSWDSPGFLWTAVEVSEERRESKEKSPISDTHQPRLHVGLPCKTYHTLLIIVMPCKEHRAAPWHAWSKRTTSVENPCGEKNTKSHLSRPLREPDWHDTFGKSTLSHFEYCQSNIIFCLLYHTEGLTHMTGDINPHPHWGFMVLWALWISRRSSSDPYQPPPLPPFCCPFNPPTHWRLLCRWPKFNTLLVVCQGNAHCGIPVVHSMAGQRKKINKMSHTLCFIPCSKRPHQDLTSGWHLVGIKHASLI